MKVSDTFVYIMKSMWRDFKKIRSSRFGDIQENAKSPNSARTKVHQNFLASKYDMKLHSDAT